MDSEVLIISFLISVAAGVTADVIYNYISKWLNGRNTNTSFKI